MFRELCPIPEDVLLLVDEVPQTASDVSHLVVSSKGELHMYFCKFMLQVVQPKLPSNVPLCSHAHNATVVPMP